MSTDTAINERRHLDLITLASEHQQAGRLMEAYEIYMELLDDDPDDANALNLLGLLSQQMGDSSQAIRLVQRAAELIPQSAQINNNLGQLLLSQARLDEAEDRLLVATRIDPDRVEPLYGLAECYRRKSDWQRAANCVKLVHERDAGHVDAMVCLGRIHLDLGKINDHAEALQNGLDILERAREMAPEHFEARFHLSRALFSSGDHAAARELLEQLISETPGNLTLHNNMGNVCMALHDFDAAVEAYSAAVELGQENADLRCNLASALWSQGDREKAQAELESGLGIMPGHERIMRLLDQVNA